MDVGEMTSRPKKCFSSFFSGPKNEISPLERCAAAVDDDDDDDDLADSAAATANVPHSLTLRLDRYTCEENLDKLGQFTRFLLATFRQMPTSGENCCTVSKNHFSVEISPRFFGSKNSFSSS